MSGNAGSPPPPDERPAGDDQPDDQTAAGPPPAPPYPGWSPQQPGGSPAAGWQSGGWQAGGPQQPGGQDPGGQGSAGAPGSAGPHAPGSTGGPGGWQSPGGWQQPAGGTPSWRIPDAKPGVIPLRPLGVGEILDGAVTTIRRNLGAMLGLSALVAAATQILSAATLAWAFGDQITEPDLGITDESEALDTLARGIPLTVATLLVTLVATVFLTGVLTVVVGRAVLGQQLSIGQAWNASKGRLLRLLGLTLLYTLIWLSPTILVIVLAIALAAAGGAPAAILAVLAGLAAIPLTVWLYVRFALSMPALMLETSTAGNGGPRPIGVRESLRRSAALVRTSWWRVFGILLLITIVVWLINQVVAVPFGLPGVLGDGPDDTTSWFVLNTLAGMIAATITAPFSAAATALLYIDRRIRREGLDIELAQAAGVELPGRGGGPTAPPSP